MIGLGQVATAVWIGYLTYLLARREHGLRRLPAAMTVALMVQSASLIHRPPLKSGAPLPDDSIVYDGRLLSWDYSVEGGEVRVETSGEAVQASIPHATVLPVGVDEIVCGHLGDGGEFMNKFSPLRTLRGRNTPRQVGTSGCGYTDGTATCQELPARNVPERKGLS